MKCKSDSTYVGQIFFFSEYSTTKDKFVYYKAGNSKIILYHGRRQKIAGSIEEIAFFAPVLQDIFNINVNKTITWI